MTFSNMRVQSIPFRTETLKLKLAHFLSMCQDVFSIVLAQKYLYVSIALLDDQIIDPSIILLNFAISQIYPYISIAQIERIHEQIFQTHIVLSKLLAETKK